MSSATIYKIGKKGYYLHADKKTESGFYIASEPFVQIIMDDVKTETISKAVWVVITFDDKQRVPDPTNWVDFNKNLLKGLQLKSLNDLDKKSTLCCLVKNNENSLIFTPTKHSDKPNRGFSHKGNEEMVTIPYPASDREIYEALMLAFSRCE